MVETEHSATCRLPNHPAKETCVLYDSVCMKFSNSKTSLWEKKMRTVVASNGIRWGLTGGWMVEVKSVTESFLSPILHPKLREKRHVSMENGSSNRNVARNLKEMWLHKVKTRNCFESGWPMDNPDGWGGQWGGRRGTGWRDAYAPWLIHVDVWQKNTTIL